MTCLDLMSRGLDNVPVDHGTYQASFIIKPRLVADPLIIIGGWPDSNCRFQVDVARRRITRGLGQNSAFTALLELEAKGEPVASPPFPSAWPQLEFLSSD